MHKVLMYPMPGSFKTHESGIRRVVEAYYKYLPKYGWRCVDGSGSFDIVAIHAGTGHEPPDVAHCHGLYWTADYNAEQWEWAANAQVVSGVRTAKQVTVPSRWVQEIFERDMRFSPTVVHHGIDWWDYKPAYSGSYVLWNKNRDKDVCDPTPVAKLAARRTDVDFVSTFSDAQLKNVRVTGTVPYNKMIDMLANCSVYLATTKETFGIGILEAMAMGKPILGFAHGGILDMVGHKVNGYLAPPGNYEALEEGLMMCLENQEKWGKNSRDLVKRFTWDNAVQKIAEVYDACLVNEPATCDIIIPVFNKKPESVARAILSARQQKEYLGRVIVVDDGSEPEKAREYRRICDEMQAEYLAKENGGVATARNAGINESSSKYICCLDSDDALDPDFLRACVPELEADRGLGIAYTGIWAIDTGGNEGLTSWPGEYDYDQQLSRRNQVPTCCVFRRTMWERLGGYKQRYAPTGAGAEDAEFWLRAGAYGYPARKVTDAGLFIYTLGKGHTSQRGYKEVDWTYWHPWTKDGKHPIASAATPENRSHAARQYDQPVVSVIIPVGPGHEDAVEDALDSLEAQTLRRWEVVVVYDGHSDLPERIKKAYPYMRLYKTSGGKGAGFARNLGVSKSRASMITYLDADDFLHPHALEQMMDAWSATGNGIYTDYLGVATVDRPDRLSGKIKVLSYDEKTKSAVMAYKAADFDCDKAMRQPENPPYIWNNITTLIPRRWHDEVGGFDESMPSWEDVLYWWQMAWSGKCFQRLESPLMTYRFTSGTRRDKGHEYWQDLIEYTRKKKETLTMAKCGTCPGNRSVKPPAQVVQNNLANMRSSAKREVSNMTDEQYVLCRYVHPNRGQHPVRGQATKEYYGHRGGGGQETFLVHREDIKLQPHLFAPVGTGPKPGSVTSEPAPEPVQEFDAEEYLARMREKWNKDLDLQSLPGVTPTVAENMKNSGFTTRDAILKVGAEGLQDAVKGIGEAKAQMIVAYLENINDSG